MNNFEIKFFALKPIDGDLEYYDEFNESELLKYIRKAKKGEIKQFRYAVIRM